MYPQTERWSAFACKLHQRTIDLVQLALVDNETISYQLHFKFFMEMLEDFTRSRLLAAFRFAQQYRAVGNHLGPETVVVTSNNIQQPIQQVNEGMARQQQQQLYRFLQCCQETSTNIQDLAKKQGEDLDGFLDAAGVEKYLEKKGIVFESTGQQTLVAYQNYPRPKHGSFNPINWIEPKVVFPDAELPSMPQTTSIDPPSSQRRTGNILRDSTMGTRIDVDSLINELAKMSVSNGIGLAFPPTAVDQIAYRTICT